ncbi:MAG: Re/Si-specific NAD(P)(+) transhydrogenase subunit alpha [Chitinophagales bacterium]|nr:Re/Si-specific NAD(P)(+) transhydrogenase subunit alpha [Chitinophagales bacterium]MDW8393352.1 Re/Si-specific NAD(P)(+) transhydrogenase subunit alpha [Chitinophagales bacterium]
MIVGLLKEPKGERRVALLPQAVEQLKRMQLEVRVESHAGLQAFAQDDAYRAAGALITDRQQVLHADLMIGIHLPAADELSRLKSGSCLIAQFQPLFQLPIVLRLAEQQLTSFSMDMVPRITRAQTMDVLSSQATVAGYRAVLVAAQYLPKFFPMLMTAAGSIAPARVLVLGAGVAGLQAIATARRLGAVVEAFDTRSAVKEEVQSLGAKFIEVEGAAESAAAGGYAVEQQESFLQRQREKICEHAAKADVVICTAQIPGKRAPLLVPMSTVQAMRPGSVIVDLAAASGGNCEATRNQEVVRTDNHITVVGHSNLPADLPADASRMYGTNLINFLKLLIKDGQLVLNLQDEIIQGTCITHQGEIVSPRVREALAQTTV